MGLNIHLSILSVFTRVPAIPIDTYIYIIIYIYMLYMHNTRLFSDFETYCNYFEHSLDDHLMFQRLEKRRCKVRSSDHPKTLRLRAREEFYEFWLSVAHQWKRWVRGIIPIYIYVYIALFLVTEVLFIISSRSWQFEWEQWWLLSGWYGVSLLQTTCLNNNIYI